MEHTLASVAKQFRIAGSVQQIEAQTSGHINQSFVVRTSKKKYLLQRINHYVFQDITGLASNILGVTNFLSEKTAVDQHSNMQVLTPVATYPNDSFILSWENSYWRMFDYIEGSQCYEKAQTPQIAFEGGRSYGWFIKVLEGFPIHRLVETIPHFHNLSSRLSFWQKTVKNDPASRVEGIPREILFIQDRIDTMRKIDFHLKSGVIPIRITHNDPKINNVLFDENNKGICVIDLDTVMPGYVHYDFGDAIRTFTNTANEDERDLSKIGMDIDLFKAFSEGFLSQLSPLMIKEEWASLAFAPQLMTFIIGLRFLTDYLQGDVYFRTNYPSHNLDRARNQLALLGSMQKQFKEMHKIILANG